MNYFPSTQSSAVFKKRVEHGIIIILKELVSGLARQRREPESLPHCSNNHIAM